MRCYHATQFVAGALLAYASLTSSSLAHASQGALLAQVAQPQAAPTPDDPPPLPPDPAPPPIQDAPPSAAPGSTLDRYQQCFQKMIDAGASDNTFMRKCLGFDAKKKLHPKSAEGDFLDKTDVEVVVKENNAGLVQCYEKLLAHSKEIGLTPEGNVDLRFDVKADGSVEALGFLPTSLTDVSLLTCFREKIAAWKFPRAMAVDKTGVNLSLRLKAKGTKGTVTLVKAYPKLSGEGTGYTPEEILAVFRKNSAGIRRCYDELARRVPGATGQASIDVLIAARGNVSRVKFREFTLRDAGFKACLDGEVRRWRFPKSRSGEPTTVKFPPFVFAPNG